MSTNMTSITTDDEGRRVEREARRAISDDRAMTAETHPWAARPDAHLAARYAVNLLHAAAALREYLTDIGGGVQGRDDYLKALCGLAADAGGEHCMCPDADDALGDADSPVDALAA